jgi:hypothetical protein
MLFINLKKLNRSLYIKHSYKIIVATRFDKNGKLRKKVRSFI